MEKTYKKEKLQMASKKLGVFNRGKKYFSSALRLLLQKRQFCPAMSFLNIVLQAEVSRFEDEDFEEVARKNCNEDPDTRQKVIQELRSMIYDRGECKPRRIDDAYLLRFLRSRQFIPSRAHRLMVRYEEFRRNCPVFYKCDVFGLSKVKHIYSGLYPESPVVGRVIIMKCGQWDMEKVSLTDVVRAGVCMAELAALQPKLQVLGLSIIADIKGLTLKQISHYTPTIAYGFASSLGVRIPSLLHGLHFVNYNGLQSAPIYLVKQFASRYKLNMVHFHGYDMSSLHEYIDPKHLPAEYGGTCKNVVPFEEWLQAIYKYKDDFLVRELKDLGYIVKD